LSAALSWPSTIPSSVPWYGSSRNRGPTLAVAFNRIGVEQRAWNHLGSSKPKDLWPRGGRTAKAALRECSEAKRSAYLYGCTVISPSLQTCGTILPFAIEGLTILGPAIWNRTRKVRGPRTGRQLNRDRPREKWKIRGAPELWIIPEDLRLQVQERFAACVSSSVYQLPSRVNSLSLPLDSFKPATSIYLFAFAFWLLDRCDVVGFIAKFLPADGDLPRSRRDKRHC
jgi:hypothetical protein